MAKIRWTNEAVAWLRDIFEYISQDNPAAAQKVIEEIYNKTQSLVEFPRIGHNYRLASDGEIRILLYGHYRITYLLSPDELITILGVFHGAMEIEKYITKN